MHQSDHNQENIDIIVFSFATSPTNYFALKEAGLCRVMYGKVGLCMPM